MVIKIGRIYVGRSYFSVTDMYADSVLNQQER